MRHRSWEKRPAPAKLATIVLMLSACHAWRIEPAITAAEPELSASAVQSSGSETRELAESLTACHRTLRAVSIEGTRQTTAHARWGAFTVVAAMTTEAGARVGTRLGTWPDASDTRRVRVTAIGIAGTAIVATWLDFRLNRGLRQARSRAAAATNTWIDLRHTINRWEVAALDLHRADSLAFPSKPPTSRTSQLAFERWDIELRDKAARCGGFQ